MEFDSEDTWVEIKKHNHPLSRNAASLLGLVFVA